MPTSKLLERTRQLLEERPRNMTLKDVADGSGLSLVWVSDFSWQRTKSPGVQNVEALYTFLAGKPLNLEA